MMKHEQLQVGTCVTDITPPLEVGLLMSSVKGIYKPFNSVRLPLKARVLVLGTAKNMVAIVALDLLSLNDTSVKGWNKFKKEVCGALDPERIILTCTHTHSAPESGALSDLHLTDGYNRWLEEMKTQIKNAVATAMEAMNPCAVSLGEAELTGFSMQRRIPTAGGVMMSDALQPVSEELMKRQPVDRRVRIISFHNDKGSAIANVVHAICHPVHEMCIPDVSPDFPGEMCAALERWGTYGMPLFLNGASGDTNPPTVSLGPAYARAHGEALATVVQNVRLKALLHESDFGFVQTSMQLAIRKSTGVINQSDAIVRISAIHVGLCAILFLPGEPFIETALEIEESSPFEHTIVVGFSENNVGYIPTRKAFQEGGYETGPGKWSYLQENADRKIIEQALRMLSEMYDKKNTNYTVYESKTNRQ